MPDTTIWNISAGVKATWAAAASLTAIIPADRVFFQRAAEGTTLPYLVYTFDDISAFFGGTEYFSGAKYVKQTRVLFDAYGTPATDWEAFSQAVNDALTWTSTDRNASWSITNATVLSAMPETEAVELTDERVNGEDVLKYSFGVTLTMQADRG